MMNTSRNTPPAAPVIVPIMIAVHQGKPSARVFSTPVTVNTANPMVSKRNHVLFWRMSALPNTATQSTAKAVHTTYVGVCIQNGVSPSIKSRTVPPPTAVVKPTTYAPNKSKRLADAKRMPEMAKANVPIKSRTCEKLGKSIGHVKFNIYLLGTKRKSR